MSLERLAAACLLPSFAGASPPDWIRAWLERGLGGVVLFARNVEAPEQLAGLTAALRSERQELLVAIDEEGGDVTRLEHARGSSYPGNHALGVVDDVELTERVGAAIGRDLAAVGVNLDLAPVADVNSNPRNPIVGVRSFGSDPELVARHVAAFVVGMQSTGVAACAKHFPGHGDTEQDSHLELPTASGDLADALLPFRAAIEAGVRAIMTAHIRVPELDDVPATLSRRILHGLLREELGFRGLTITDALEMRAVSAAVGVEDGAVRALAAGADALCLGADLGADAVERVHEAILDAVRDGRLGEERLREAAARVEEAGRRDDVGAESARRALEVQGRVELDRPPLVVELVAEPSIAAGPAAHTFADSLRARDPATEAVWLSEGEEFPADDRGRPLVLVVRDAHRHAWQRETVARLAAGGEPVVVEVGLPLWRPSRARGYVVTHGAGRANFAAAAERLLPSSATSSGETEALPARR